MESATTIVARRRRGREKLREEIEAHRNERRKKLDGIVTAALKRAMPKRPEVEWPTALDRVAAVVEEIAAAPWRRPKPPPPATRAKIKRLVLGLHDALAKADFAMRRAIIEADPRLPALGHFETGNLFARLEPALSDLLAALAALNKGRGQPPVPMVGAVANSLAHTWHAEGLPFSTSDTAPWPEFVAHVFKVAGTEWPEFFKDGVAGLPNARQHARAASADHRAAAAYTAAVKLAITAFSDYASSGLICDEQRAEAKPRRR